jgi:hypothetical protein
MGNESKKPSVSEIDKSIRSINDQADLLKEAELVNLIVDILVLLTLKQYYETSNKIPKIQPAGPK